MMKKAKEYAQQYNDNPTVDMLTQIIACFLTECAEMIKNRQCKTSEAVNAVLDEQNRKWKAMSRHTNDRIAPGAFEYLVENDMPEVWQEWKGGKSADES